MSKTQAPSDTTTTTTGTNSALSRVLDIVDANNKVKKDKIKEFMTEVAKVVEAFSIKNQLVVYGGFALNELLPPTKKFYTSEDLPDYDFLSPTARKHSLMLADELKQAGYTYVEVKGAIHDGTYKVYANFQAVADISDSSKSYFEGILAMSDKQKASAQIQQNVQTGMYLAPIDLLKRNMYSEMSHPIKSAWRWGKVFKRYQIFMSEYANYRASEESADLNIVYGLQAATISNPTITLVIDQLLKWIKRENVPLIGAIAVQLIKGVNMHSSVDIAYSNIMRLFSVFEILSTDIQHTIGAVQEMIGTIDPKIKITIEKREMYDELIPKRVHILLKLGSTATASAIDIATIYDVSETDTGIVQAHGYTLGSGSCVLDIMYGYFIMYNIHRKNKKASGFILQSIRDFEGYIKSLKSSAAVPIMCSTLSIGSVNSTKTAVKRERWNKEEEGFKYRPE